MTFGQIYLPSVSQPIHPPTDPASAQELHLCRLVIQHAHATRGRGGAPAESATCPQNLKKHNLHRLTHSLHRETKAQRLQLQPTPACKKKTALTHPAGTLLTSAISDADQPSKIIKTRVARRNLKLHQTETDLKLDPPGGSVRWTDGSVDTVDTRAPTPHTQSTEPPETSRRRSSQLLRFFSPHRRHVAVSRSQRALHLTVVSICRQLHVPPSTLQAFGSRLQ